MKRIKKEVITMKWIKPVLTPLASGKRALGAPCYVGNYPHPDCTNGGTPG